MKLNADLAPVDKDGDTVVCRWATAAEAGGISKIENNVDRWPSLILDEDNCIVHYDKSKFNGRTESGGLKGIAIMMEDKDPDGNVKSSIPVQFLAVVYNPNDSARSDNSARSGNSAPSTMASYWFGDDHDHHHAMDNNTHTNDSQNRQGSKIISE